jgi:hypothetical protein
MRITDNGRDSHETWSETVLRTSSVLCRGEDTSKPAGDMKEGTGLRVRGVPEREYIGEYGGVGSCSLRCETKPD